MEEILKQVEKYDIPELRKKLIENNVNVGPIYPGSKPMFQRRLARKLFELQGGKLEDEDGVETRTESKDKPLKEKTETTAAAAESPNKSPDVFYAICLPESVDSETKREVNQLVFSDKVLALKTAKRVKNSRFKVFKSEKEAEQFSKLTAESAFNSPRPVPNDREDMKEKQAATESSPYKSPRPQETVVLRKAIEGGNEDFFKKWIWDNPRYLVGSGDTPVIYQEGFRYTAMHIAALKNKPSICRVILDTIENPDFIRQLYSQSLHTVETQNSRINFLVDLYLNMPDKGNCESPLHMACKFGYDEVVEILIAHPKTDRKRQNKWGDTPKDIICTRSPKASAGLKERIEMLLEGQSYVPLMRSDDNSTVPVIGQPWSPDKQSSLQREDKTWSPKDPSMSVKAYAGPMSPSNARSFHKRWTTPPSQSPDQAKKYIDIKRSDSDKGLERIGRQLAHEMQIPWLEHWECLNSYVDLSSDNGLELLEKYFKKTIWLEYVKSYKEKNGLNENSSDFLTPVKRSKPVVDKDSEEGLYSETNINLSGRISMKTKKSCDLTDGSDSRHNVTVSPMMSLAQSFAQIKLQDESWSEEATVSSSADVSSEEDVKESETTNQSDVNSNELNSKQDKDIVDPKILGDGKNKTSMFNVTDMKKDNITGDKDPINDTKDNKTLEIDHSNGTEIKGDLTDDQDKTAKIKKERSVKDSKTLEIDHSNETEIKGDLTDDQDKTAKIKKERSVKVSNTLEIDHSNETEIKGDLTDDQDKTAKIKKERSVKDSKTLEIDHSNETEIKGDLTDDQDKTAKIKKERSVKDNNTLEIDHSNGSEINGDLTDDQDKTAKLKKERSVSTDSSDSFKTTLDDVEDTDIATFHDVEEEDKRVCINLCDNGALDQLRLHVQKQTNLSEVSDCCAHLVVRLKSVRNHSGLKVDLISLPGADIVRCSELFMLEDVDVSSLEGDIGGTEEGEVVEIGAPNYNADTPIYAYMSRTVTLPKVAYLHGPQPTREDLDVSRALGDVVIVPDLYPNVFQWKIKLSRFLRDTNYKWQSPAKVRSRLQQASPQASPLRKSSPVIQYGSPLGLKSQQKITASSDIRTRLFQSIAE